MGEPGRKGRAGMVADRLRTWGAALTAALLLAALAGCSSQNENAIRVTGSDTMVNLVQAWAEAFAETHPDASVQIRGGGSGVGIASLCAGKIQIAASSRPMKPKELETAHEKTGATPQEFVVGSDALAVYVNRQNPIDEISLEQLAEIYGEGGQIVAWDQLGVSNAACSDGQIIRVSRQNSSGTYAYFRERVLGKKREYKQGATAQSGSADIVALVSQTPCAIGYSGMGYNSDEVKVLKITPKPGEPAVAPSLETAQNGTYPIARPLYLYTLGEPKGAVAEFLEWILSDEGQKIVAKKGYVPLVQATAAP